MYVPLFIFFVISQSFHSVISSTLPLPELHMKYGGLALNALEYLLNFFESDVNDLNLDGLYGLRIAQGQLNDLHEMLTLKSNERHRFTDKNNHLQSLYRKIEHIANRSSVVLARKAPSYLRRFLFVVSKPFRVNYERRKINQSLIENGSKNSDFDEDESDACFAELLGSSDHLHSKKCFVTVTCWKMMTSPKANGYLLTHQLLWFLIAKNIGCTDHPTVSNLANQNLKHLEDRYCSNIYQDAQLNIQENYNQDLFLEQLLLCSIIGYEEFLRYDWLEEILTWQNLNYGCFSDESNRIQMNARTRRHLLVEQEMKHRCLSHKSGLAAGLLATYSRALLQ